jgi:hypothetical protein
MTRSSVLFGGAATLLALAALKALASKTLPTLEKHHQLVSQLAAGESKSTSR